jgi:hypothetical protein
MGAITFSIVPQFVPPLQRCQLRRNLRLLVSAKSYGAANEGADFDGVSKSV